jgi:alpha-ketoglutarate-dependent taurine dioxygenase
MTYQSFELKRLSGAIGAELSGVDLTCDLTNRQFDEIHQAFLDHLVIFFRDQALAPERQVALARRFGKPMVFAFAKGMEGAPAITEIVKAPDQTKSFGDMWHSDSCYLAVPPMATMLYAVETPPVGGDTMFANACMAYDALSDGMKAMIEPVRVVFSSALKSEGGRAANMAERGAMTATNMDKADAFEAEHPLVRVHPETGRKALYVNTHHAVRFAGMTEAESKPLMTWLCRHIARPEFTCRFRWTPGSLALWDNRAAQHFAINDYHGQRRHMRRVTIAAA